MIIITLPNFSQTSVTQGLNHQAVYGLHLGSPYLKQSCLKHISQPTHSVSFPVQVIRNGLTAVT